MIVNFHSLLWSKYGIFISVLNLDTMESWYYLMNSISYFYLYLDILLPKIIWWHKVPSLLKPKIQTTTNTPFYLMVSTSILHTSVSLPNNCMTYIFSVRGYYVLVLYEKWQIIRWIKFSVKKWWHWVKNFSLFVSNTMYFTTHSDSYLL